MSPTNVLTLRNGMVLAVAVLLLGLAAFWVSQMIAASTPDDNLPPSAAVPMAQEWAANSEHGGPGFGGLDTSADFQVSGEVITLGGAVQIQRGHSISRESLEWSDRNSEVWMIFFDGEVDGASTVNGVREPTPTEYSRVIVVMDAATGDIISRSAYPVGHPTNNVSSTSLQQYVEAPD